MNLVKTVNDMTNILIIIGLVLLVICGIILTSYGAISIDSDPSIKNFALLLTGVIMICLWIHLLIRERDSNHKLYEETHLTEIVTSVLPQIDTTITIKSGVSDTTYTYIFQKQFINSK